MALVVVVQEPSSIEKVAEVDSHIGVAMSGLTADARTLIDHARVESQQHRFTYNEPMPVESITQSLCDLALRFGEDEEEGSMVRTADSSTCACYCFCNNRVCLCIFNDDNGVATVWMIVIIMLV